MVHFLHLVGLSAGFLLLESRRMGRLSWRPLSFPLRPRSPLRVCSGQFFAYELMTLSVLALVRSRGFSCRLRAFLAVGLLPRASKAGVHGEMWSFSLRLQPPV